MSISLTIPRDDKEALVAGATMLLTLAGKIPPMELDDGQCPSCDDGKCTASTGCVAPGNPPPAVVPAEFVGRDKATDAGEPPFYWYDSASGSMGVCESLDEIIESDAELIDAAEYNRLLHEQISTTTAPSSDNPESQPTTGPDLDADGLPWDARIHAGSKKKNQGDGCWKKKRGIDDETRATVEAELRQVMAVPAAPSEPTAPVPSEPAAPVPPVPPVPGVQSESQAEATPPTPPGVDPFTKPQAESAPTTYAEFIRGVTKMVSTDKAIDMNRVNEVLNNNGVANIQLVNSRPDLIPQLWKELNNAS